MVEKIKVIRDTKQKLVPKPVQTEETEKHVRIPRRKKPYIQFPPEYYEQFRKDMEYYFEHRQ